MSKSEFKSLTCSGSLDIFTCSSTTPGKEHCSHGAPQVPGLLPFRLFNPHKPKPEGLVNNTHTHTHQLPALCSVSAATSKTQASPEQLHTCGETVGRSRVLSRRGKQEGGADKERVSRELNEFFKTAGSGKSWPEE